MPVSHNLSPLPHKAAGGGSQNENCWLAIGRHFIILQEYLQSVNHPGGIRMKAVISLAIGLALIGPVYGQVGSSISADGSAPNPNAMLDVQSPATGAGKGILIPRITQAQRTTASAAVAGGLLNDAGELRGGAAQGLLVYQTDGSQGLYFNASTLAAPAWVYLGSSTTNYLPLTGGTMSGALNMGAQIITNVSHIDFSGFTVSVGNQANGDSIGAAVGQVANAYNYGAAVGRGANGAEKGAAVGYNAKGYYFGVGLGDAANGTNAGAAVGYVAYAVDYGAALGYLANGSISGAVVGCQANGFELGAVVGSSANGTGGGAALGCQANGYYYGAAVGKEANGSSYGAAMGMEANGYDNGAGIGYKANGYNHGAALGYQANGYWCAAVGYQANSELSGAAVGYQANGRNFGAALGEMTKGTNSGAAVGYTANGSDAGAVVGAYAKAYRYGAALGVLANGIIDGAAVGYAANGSDSGAAMGENANGRTFGAVIGAAANGYSAGSVAGRAANGAYSGLACGIGADGSFAGAAMGYLANGSLTNVAIGYQANAGGSTNSIAIGYNVTNTVTNSVRLRGTLYLDGATNIFCRTNFATGIWYNKAFEIDHPLDPQHKILRHFCLEGPQVWNVYAGNVQLVNGRAVVQLPDYYAALNLVGSEIYSLTPIGGAYAVGVGQKVQGNRFVIVAEKDMEVSWTIKVLRNDPGCLDDLKRRPVEQLKSEIQ
jgi:hypothetical protein